MYGFLEQHFSCAGSPEAAGVTRAPKSKRHNERRISSATRVFTLISNGRITTDRCTSSRIQCGPARCEIIGSFQRGCRTLFARYQLPLVIRPRLFVVRTTVNTTTTVESRVRSRRDSVVGLVTDVLHTHAAICLGVTLARRRLRETLIQRSSSPRIRGSRGREVTSSRGYTRRFLSFIWPLSARSNCFYRADDEAV